MSPSASSSRPDSAGRKKRPRPLPHVNARNLAIEKKRREQMNGNFLDLAHLVPSLANTQRLTKVHIIGQTIEHLREQQELCATAARDMQELLAENYRLAAEVNVLRSAVQGSVAAPPAQVLSVPETMARLVFISQLGFGTATLRDANEGPEPKAKLSPVTSQNHVAAAAASYPQAAAPSPEVQRAAAASHHHMVDPLPALQGDNTMAPQVNMWNPVYDFEALPMPHQPQYPWPTQPVQQSQPPQAPADASPSFTATDMPSPPQDVLEYDVLDHFAGYNKVMNNSVINGIRYFSLIPWPGPPPSRG